MLMIIQNYRSGKLSVKDAPEPQAHPQGMLVCTANSLVSSGTERLITQTAKKSLIGKARARPDLVKRVLQKARTDGLRETYRAVRSRLDQTIPLGYSSSGTVKRVSPGITEFSIGDRVACFGAEFASHSELESIPAALASKIPDSVDFEEAAFAGVGAIALHAVNHGAVSSGQKVVVIGLGLIGTLAVQILVSKGCEVYGVEPNRQRADLAKSLGATEVINPDDAARSSSLSIETGFGGFTHAFVFASSRSSGPIETAAQLLTNRGRLVAPGMVGLDLPRHLFYEKEIELVVPRSAGPGSETAGVVETGDPSTENPMPSANKNLTEFLSLIENQKVRVRELITDRYPIANAAAAYETLDSKSQSVGVLIDYSADSQSSNSSRFTQPESEPIISNHAPVQLGFIGAGMWAKNTLLPEFSRIKEVGLAGVVTRNPVNASHVAESWKFESAHSSVDELLQNPNIDAVVITTRHDTHASLAVQALQAGKHVFVEKPAALNIEELKLLMTEFARSGRVLFSGFNRRFAPDSIAARQFVGDHRVAVSVRVNPGSVPADHWSVDESQGGRIVGEMCHFVDLLTFITGSRIKRVSAESIVGKAGTSESVAASFAHENGSVSSLLYGTDGDRGAARETIEVVGGGGVLTINDFKGHRLSLHGKNSRKRRSSIDRGHKDEIRAFINAISGKPRVTNTFDHIADAMIATFALEKAVSTGSSVDVTHQPTSDAT